MPLHPLPAGGPETRGQRRGFQEPADGAGQRMCVPRPHEQPGGAVLDGFRAASTSVATTGTPAAIASSTAFGSPSPLTEGSTETAVSVRRSDTSSLNPVNTTRPFRPSRATARSSSVR